MSLLTIIHEDLPLELPAALTLKGALGAPAHELRARLTVRRLPVDEARARMKRMQAEGAELAALVDAMAGEILGVAEVSVAGRTPDGPVSAGDFLAAVRLCDSESMFKLALAVINASLLEHEKN